jgi:hypothetical protein
LAWGDSGSFIAPRALTWVTLVVAIALAGVRSAEAVDHLIGHKTSITSYGGSPVVGKLHKFVAKAGRDGNPAAFALPANPSGNGGAVTIGRDGGLLTDPLSGGSWSGLGNPPGASGWKYVNKDAPAGGAVKLLLLKPNGIKLIAKAVGSMPAPTAANAAIDTLIAIDNRRYCARAASPHFKEVANRVVKATNQVPPAECPCFLGTDTDEDRLDDCYETNSGTFVSPTDTGTHPQNSDTDADGLSDGDEVLGTVAGTAAGLDLAAMGASPLRRDILIEYDWFDDALECGAHSHEPTAAALAQVTAAFAAAPLSNPDGSTGINVIHDYGQGGVFSGGNLIPDADGVITGGVNGPNYAQLKEDNFDPIRSGYFHYTIMPHRYDTDSASSGQAELPGDDMIVSLYCAGSDDNVAHTIMHELGHNLRLRHGGTDNCNYKPNYNSVMNYRYQFPGVDSNCTPPGNGVLDYSYGDRIALDENDLDENLGVCGAPGWDWNGNSILESGVVQDINSAEPLQVQRCGGVLTVLRDANDWANVWFLGVNDGDGARLAAPEIIDCDNPAPLPDDG